MATVVSFVKWFLLVGGMLFWFFVFVGVVSSRNEEQMIDCSTAELRSDYPTEVKEECRRTRHVLNT